MNTTAARLYCLIQLVFLVVTVGCCAESCCAKLAGFPVHRFAVYDGMRVLMESDRSEDVAHIDGGRVIPEIYVGGPDEELVYLPTLTEETVIQWCKDADPHFNRNDHSTGSDRFHYPLDGMSIGFLEGKMSSFHIKRGAEIRRTPDGPYFQWNEESLIEMFGEPLRWEKKSSGWAFY